MKERKKGRTLRRWRLSYLLILLLPLIFGCVIYFHSLSTIYRETEELQYQLLQQDEIVLKNVLGQLRRNGTELLNNTYVKSLAITDISPELERDRLGMVQDLLQNHISVAKTLSSVYLFYPKRELIVGSRVSFRITDEMWVQEDYYLSDPAFKTILEGEPYNRLYLLQGNKSDALAYSISGNYRGSFQEQDIVLLCFLSKTWLSEQFSNLDTAVLLKAEDGTVRKIGGGLEEEKKEEDWASLIMEKEEMVHKNGYAILTRVLSDYQISLSCILKDLEFQQELFVGIGILAVYIIACLGAGISLSSYLSKKNYKPVDEILKLIRKNGGIEEQEDEFELIRSRLQKLLKNYEQKAEESFRQEQLVRDAQVSRLLIGQKNKYASLEQEEWKHLKEALPNANYLVLQFDFEEVEEVLLGEQLNEESLQLLYFIVRNVAGDMFKSQYPFLSGSLGGFCYFILNGNGDLEGFETKVKQIVEEMIGFLQQTYGFRICVNFSLSGTGLSEIETGYQQVRRLNEYRNHVGTPYTVLSYRQVQTVLTAWEEEQERELSKLPEKPAKTKKNPSGRKGNTERTETLEETIETIRHWLEEHYSDPQLTVAVIAERFSMNLTYLSRVFKQKTGIGVLDYINQLRVERAKELLQEGFTVKAAAEEVGYYTVRPLMRFFREQTGMTPGEYAKLQTRK